MRKNVDNVLKVYKKFRKNENSKYKFWDVVVLTAIDETQKKAYEQQIAQKCQLREIPAKPNYEVISDPEGSKIGCGGATMHALHQLYHKYGESLYSKCILLVNTGGYSKRLPSAGVLGKVFMAVPYGDELWTVLDLKLALYLPYVQKMSPGVFQTSSDTIELFHMDWELPEDSNNEFQLPGFTALAHPSPLNIGSSHGVFVLDAYKKDPSLFAGKSVELVNCSRVLQKPSIDKMIETKAVLKEEDEGGNMIEFVYTDSSFFFDHQISRVFVDFYLAQQPLGCEINGYEDFMKGLTTPDDFLQESSKDPSVSTRHLQVRKALVEALKEHNFNVLALNLSEFFHFGSMPECLDNLNPQGHLSLLINWKSTVLTEDKALLSIHPTSISIHNALYKHASLLERSLMEFCLVACAIKVNSNCIISNCHMNGTDPIHLPPNIFLHTVPLRLPSNTSTDLELSYTTLLFDLQDDLKSTFDNSTDFLSRNITAKRFKLDEALKNSIDFEEGVCSLWTAKLFPVASCRKESFTQTLHITTTSSDLQAHKLISVSEAMKYGDADEAIRYRTDLRERIMEIEDFNSKS